MTLFMASSAGWVYPLGNLYILFVVEGGETVILSSSSHSLLTSDLNTLVGKETYGIIES